MAIKTIPVIYLSIIGLLMPFPLAAGGTGGLTESQAGARELLMDMAKFLSQTRQFSVNINGGYEAVQESGQKIEFNSTRKILLSRPNHLRVEGEKSGGGDPPPVEAASWHAYLYHGGPPNGLPVRRLTRTGCRRPRVRRWKALCRPSCGCRSRAAPGGGSGETARRSTAGRTWVCYGRLEARSSPGAARR